MVRYFTKLITERNRSGLFFISLRVFSFLEKLTHIHIEIDLEKRDLVDMD